MKKFVFKGSIMCFQNILEQNVVLETQAISLSKAVNNLKYQAKQRLGMKPNSKLTLFGKIT